MIAQLTRAIVSRYILARDEADLIVLSQGGDPNTYYK